MSSHSGTPGKKNQKSIEDKRDTDHNNDPAQGKPSATHKIDPTPVRFSDPYQPWYKTVQGWKTTLGFVGILAAIGYAVVTYFQ